MDDFDRFKKLDYWFSHLMEKMDTDWPQGDLRNSRFPELKQYLDNRENTPVDLLILCRAENKNVPIAYWRGIGKIFQPVILENDKDSIFGRMQKTGVFYFAIDSSFQDDTFQKQLENDTPEGFAVSWSPYPVALTIIAKLEKAAYCSANNNSLSHLNRVELRRDGIN